MTREDIIRMAREAGAMFDHMTWVERDLAPVFERFAALVAAHERELIVRECADVLRKESERLYRLSAEETDELFASNFEICAEKCVDNEVAIKEHFGVEE